MEARGIGQLKRSAIGAAIAGSFLLDEKPEGVRYFLGGEISGPGTAGRSIEQIARRLTAQYGKNDVVELNDTVFQSLIKNFNDNVYGQEIYVDRSHDPDAGVQGKVERLFQDGDRFLMEMSWTTEGIEAFSKKGFKYFSMEFHPNYQDRETKKLHGPTLFGVAMTPRPFIKHMTPSQGPGRLALSEGRSLFVADYLNLTGDTMTLAELLKKLSQAAKAKKLSATAIGILIAQCKHAVESKKLSEGDELKTLCDEYVSLADTLAKDESMLEKPAGSDAKMLTSDDVATIVEQTLAKSADKAKKLAETETSNRKLFTDAIDARKNLSDSTKELLKKQASAINGEMSADAVQAIVDATLSLGDHMEVQAKKAGLGIPGPNGIVSIVSVPGGEGSQLHALMREKLLLSDVAGQMALPEEKDLSPFAKRVLAHFDQLHGPRVEAERKFLAGDGSTNIADGQFPIAAQRQVIVELLADLLIMSLVQTLVDANATVTTQIPYEVRNVATIKNGAIVYEGQGIPRAGVTQTMDTAYIIPRKIAMLMSNEMIHFSRSNGLINWDAWARNIASNSRLMKDLVAVAIINELQRTADTFGAANVSSEAITAQVNGTRKVFKTAQFPIVRPRQVRDLQGNAVGSAENPITFVYNGNTLPMYDGTGTQTAGNYIEITDWNLGLFHVVNQAGAEQTLAAQTTTISYSYATNVDKFDIDQGSADYDVHLNGLLNKFGRRKAMLRDDRFVTPNFALMSATLHNTITEAKQYEANSQKAGTGLNSEGDLERVKGVPCFGTIQPGSDLGDSRIIIGERGTLSYTIAKPFNTGTPFEAVDSNGRPTAQKIAYGEEYSSIHVPAPIRNRCTSIVVFSTTARNAI